MGCKVEACEGCTRRCLLVHSKKKNSSPTITSFFKVMIGDQFSKVLFLPPKFVPTVSELIGQETFLEDASAQQWKVTISNLNGSVAFRQGWNEFSVDHRLEVGDFLVLYYVVGSHFVVKIYNKTGCEKLEFPKRKFQKKKRRTNRKSTAKDASCQTTNKGSISNHSSGRSFVSGSDAEISRSQCELTDMEKVNIAEYTSNNDDSNIRPPPLPHANYVEEPFYMMNRDFEDKQAEDRISIFDLSNFEMWKSNSGPNGSNKERFCHDADTSLRSTLEAGLVNQDLGVEDVMGRIVPLDTSDFKTKEKNNSEELDMAVTFSYEGSWDNKISEHLMTEPAVRPGNNRGNHSDTSNEVIKECQIAERRGKTQSRSVVDNDQVVASKRKCAPLIDDSESAQLKLTGMSESLGVALVTEMQNCQLGEKLKVIKKESLQMNPELLNHEKIQEKCGKEPILIKKETCESLHAVAQEDKTYEVVEIETVDSSPITASCFVTTDSQSFIGLSTRLPPSSYRGGKNMKRRVVLLRDPDMRLWPVLYHERWGSDVLTSGWEAFRKANNIQPGDECVFGVESKSEQIFGVRIIRR